MIFPQEIYQAAATEIKGELVRAGYGTLPQMVAKEYNTPFETHLGPVTLDNQFHVAFCVSEELLNRPADVAREYLVPATFALARYAQRLAMARIQNAISLYQPGPSAETACTIDGRHERGHLQEVRVTARHEEGPLAVGDSIRIRGHRYGVMQATRDGSRMKVILDRGLHTALNTGVVVKKLRLSRPGSPHEATIVTAPTQLPGYYCTERDLGLSFREEPYAGNNALTVITLVLNGGIILNGF